MFTIWEMYAAEVFGMACGIILARVWYKPKRDSRGRFRKG